MKKILIIAALLAASLGMTSRVLAAPTIADVPRMSIEELKAQLDNPNLVIIDVRTAHDWEAGTTKIKGAIREDAHKLSEWMAKYPPDKTLVLYCG